MNISQVSRIAAEHCADCEIEVRKDPALGGFVVSHVSSSGARCSCWFAFTHVEDADAEPSVRAWLRSLHAKNEAKA